MTIAQLKQLGHELFDEYVALAKQAGIKMNGTIAYEQLGERLKGQTPHFGQMHTKAELMYAIGMLKKMMYPLKNK